MTVAMTARVWSSVPSANLKSNSRCPSCQPENDAWLRGRCGAGSHLLLTSSSTSSQRNVHLRNAVDGWLERELVSFIFVRRGSGLSEKQHTSQLARLRGYDTIEGLRQHQNCASSHFEIAAAWKSSDIRHVRIHNRAWYPWRLNLAHAASSSAPTSSSSSHSSPSPSPSSYPSPSPSSSSLSSPLPSLSPPLGS